MTMAFTNGFNKKMAELVYGVHEGDTVRILSMSDPYIPQGSYNGKEGVVQSIDDAGQLHGTWGGLALIPGEDRFEIIKHAEVPGKLYLFAVRFEGKRIEIFAGNTDVATRIFNANYGPNKNPQITLVREATKQEYKEVENTGAPSPSRDRRVEMPWDYGKHFD